jgi:unsaturated rhamnogalacturonyl hydrolase
MTINSDFSLQSFDFIFSNLEYFKKQYEEKVPGSSFLQYFRLNKLDDCGAMSAALADVNILARKKEYQDYLEKATNFITNKQVRLNDGTFVRPEPRKMTLWADDLYMSVPFLSRMGKLTGDMKYFDDAIKQVKNFTKYLYDPATGLFYHCWYSDVQLNGVSHWGRCNGWIMLAQTELLNNLPANHPEKKNLIKLLLKQIAGVSRWQDTTGLWHQVLDKPDSYLETSCTAMFVYSIARAVNEGWIDKSYLSVAVNGWNGLKTKIQPDGKVQDICIGTGIEDNLLFYYNRPTELNDLHGLGAVILAGTEMIKAEQKEKNKIY